MGKDSGSEDSVPDPAALSARGLFLVGRRPGTWPTLNPFGCRLLKMCYWTLVPGRMDRQCETLRTKLKASPKLNDRQKDLVKRGNDDESGFCKALTSAGSVDYNVDQVIFSSFLYTRGIWKYDEEDDTLWHWKWGMRHPKLSKCAKCGARPPSLMVCMDCKESREAPLYCNKDCQRADWPRHREKCKTFKIMKKGGTRDELLDRLRKLH